MYFTTIKNNQRKHLLSDSSNDGPWDYLSKSETPSGLWCSAEDATTPASNPSPLGSWNSTRGARKNVRAGRRGRVLWIAVFWARLGCYAHETTATVTSCQGSGGDQISSNFKHGGGGAPEVSSLAEERLAIGGGWRSGKSLLFGVWLLRVAHASLDDPVWPALIGLSVLLKT